MSGAAANRQCTHCGLIRNVADFYARQAKCKDCSKRYAAAWNKANPERVNANNRAARARNPERYREHDKKQRARKPAGYSTAQSTAWRLKNPQAAKAQRCAAASRRRALLRAATGSHTYQERQDLFASYSWLCAYCTHVATDIDHVTPLIRGGTNDIGNLVPACGHCNTSKHDSSLLQFLLRRKAA